jgi:hypothetical protein
MKVLRFVAIWLALIVVFVAFFLYFQRSRTETDSALDWVPVVFIGLFVPIFVFVFLRARRGVGLVNEGVALLSQGRPLAALERFEQARPRLSRNPIVPFNIAAANLALWRTAAAEREYAGMNKLYWIGPGLKPMAESARFLIAALEGRRDDATRWLEGLRGTASESSATVLLGQSVLAARDGRWQDVQTLLDRYEVKALGGTLRGLSDALLAWADAQGGSPSRRPFDRVALFGEAGSDALAPVWPELVAFVRTASVR